MALQVIGAGFGRTGTLSLKLALEQLGYVKCHHMMEVFRSSEQVDAWDAIGRGERRNWDDVFRGFQASVDFPSSVYWRELAEAYPDAKVILTVRSPESWYDSARSTIYALGRAMPPWMLWFPQPRKIGAMAERVVWQKLFDGRFEDKEYACKVFEANVEAVKATIPPERLLVFEVKEGWVPLCRFLDKPIPDRPFPHANDKAEFQRRIHFMRRIRYLPHLSFGLIVTLVALYLWLRT